MHIAGHTIALLVDLKFLRLLFQYLLFRLVNDRNSTSKTRTTCSGDADKTIRPFRMREKQRCRRDERQRNLPRKYESNRRDNEIEELNAILAHETEGHQRRTCPCPKKDNGS